MKTKPYSRYLVVPDELDKLLKKVFMNHLVVYNHCLGVLCDNPTMTFKGLKKHATQYVETKQISPVFDLALYNELYYQYNKFKSNIRVQKLVTDIQYFTFLLKGYECKNIHISPDRMKISFSDIEGQIDLDEPLPELSSEDITYLNISYSNQENRYKLSLHRSS